MTISARVQDVRGRRPQGVIGGLVESNYLDAIKTLINSDPQAYQVSTLVVDTATNSRVYEATINGTEVTYTADGATSKIEIADGLAAAINASPMVRGQVSASSDGVATVTLTGLIAGEVFTITAVDAQLTAATTTTAAVADAIPFGRLVVTGGYQTNEANELCKLCKAAAFAAQVDTFTVDYAAAEVYTIGITIDGETYTSVVTANTDDATTATDIRTAINAMMPANTVIATGATDQVILTAEVLGKPFVTTGSVASETVARLALAHTTATPATDINRIARGVSLYTQDEADLTITGNDVTYPANSGVKVLSKGLVWVESAQTIANGDKVYVETGVAADNGQFYNTSSATRILLANARWERDERSTQSDGIAVVRLNLPVM